MRRLSSVLFVVLAACPHPAPPASDRGAGPAVSAPPDRALAEKERLAAVDAADAGDAEAQLAHLDASLKAAPAYTPSELDLAEALLFRGVELDRAAAALDTAFPRESANARLWRLRGNLAEQRGAPPAAAAAAYERAVELDPADRATRRRLAQKLLADGKAAAAVAELETLKAQAPEDRDCRLALAEGYEKAGRLALAEDELSQLAALDAKNPFYHRRLADLFDRQGDRKQADAERAKAAALAGQQSGARKLRPLLPSKK